MFVDLSICRRSALPAPDDDAFHHWVGTALRYVDRPGTAELCLSLVGRTEMKQLNQQFRRRQGLSNVLSFPAGPAPTAVLGDIVICSAVVALEAAQQHKNTAAHWAHMTVHGLLHLLNYKHETDAEASIMEGLETVILTALDYPPPYRELPATEKFSA